MPLTQERLLQTLSYAPATGEFRRRTTGKVAGCIDKDGYRVIGVDRRLYKAGPLAWLYVTGEWPDLIVDHINTDRADDRWDNLRLATRSQNQGNRRMNAKNSTGFKGVSYHKRDKRYLAHIGVGGRLHYLGSFGTAEEASLAYAKASRELRGEFGRVATPNAAHGG